MYCHSCGKSNPKNSKFCQHCGISLKALSKSLRKELETKSSTQAAKETEYIDQDQEPYPYVVSLPKFIFLNIITLNLYQAYWFYKQFKSFKHELNWSIKPFWRSIFAGFTSFTLFEKIGIAVTSIDPNKSLASIAWATFYLLISLLWKLPEPYWLLSILSFLPLIPVQTAINYYWKERLGDKLVKSKFGLGNWIWSIIGALLCALCIYGLYGMDEKGNDKWFSNLNQVEKVAVEEVEAATDNGDWIVFTEEAKGFSQSFPQEPEYSIDNTGDFPYETYSNAIGENLYYEVGIATYDDTVDTSNPSVLLNEVLSAMVTSDIRNELISSQNESLNNIPVKEYTIKQDGVILKGILIVNDNKLYSVIVSYLESDGEPKDYKKFIGSFKFL